MVTHKQWLNVLHTHTWSHGKVRKLFHSFEVTGKAFDGKSSR